MVIKVVTKSPEIDTVPFHEVCIGHKKQYIEFDDVDEKRWKINFKTVQAWRITDVDCADLTLAVTNDAIDKDGITHHFILEVIDSEWIKELKKEYLSRHSEDICFEESHHYVLPLGDDIVEIVAWDNYTLEQIG